MTYNALAVRSHFPSLNEGLAHFDGPGGTQTPRQVGAAIALALTRPLSNRGTRSLPERNADDAVTGFRLACADLLGADPLGIVYGRSATALTYDFSRHLAKDWGPGDEVVVTRLDHDANIRPWIQAAEHVGATVRWVDFDPATGELSAEMVAAAITPNTRLVAVTAASNLIGTRPPITEIAALAHAVGALLWVDGVHYTAHTSVDVHALGADFFVCSPYKFLGPHCGVLAADPALLDTIHPDKLLASTDAVPERFEFGTLPYETMAGVTAAIDFLAALVPGDAAAGTASRRAQLVHSFAALEQHEATLLARLESGLADLPGVTIRSLAADRTPTLLLTFAGHSAADASQFLSERRVLAPAGSFYALEASRHLGLGDEGGLRIGLAPYTNAGEVERLLVGLEDFLLPA
ncbi:cysteine desulfurase-like protein [Cryobacterium psychrophilum]|uniref:Cysteine desulfurase-like protein n=1 Tax=Cryobacterium psychrophilum TaxID=41988 RepID=A0A4Y8KMM3_9MICO|nr:cysteine desulfurase-like protein [Cryobacterium psychrophilum]TDW30291.1 cysteine desulfurase family protein (TIGR01976 family) [Cryobacterium psychrophilum]TFD77507.1 cysteine desulfurase-like protein [Cryobacterium psychrophilum]